MQQSYCLLNAWVILQVVSGINDQCDSKDKSCSGTDLKLTTIDPVKVSVIATISLINVL